MTLHAYGCSFVTLLSVPQVLSPKAVHPRQRIETMPVVDAQEQKLGLCIMRS